MPLATACGGANSAETAAYQLQHCDCVLCYACPSLAQLPLSPGAVGSEAAAGVPLNAVNTGTA